MVSVEYHKEFIKSFKRRFRNNVKVRQQYERRLKLFLSNPQSPILRDHALVGDKLKLRAFSVTGDIRVVYKEYNERVVFLDIGTHNQVY